MSSIAQQVATSASHASEAADMAMTKGATVDQDWSAEETRYAFEDGSSLVCSGPLFWAVRQFEVSANGTVFGTYAADSEQAARDLCAQDAGYKSEADMIGQLERPSELVAREVEAA